MGGTQRRRVEETTGRDDYTTTTAFEIIESFLNVKEATARVKDAWRRVREVAGEAGTRQGSPQERLQEDVTEIKAMMKRIVAKPTYAQMAGRNSVATERVADPPRKRQREVVIAGGKETSEQAHRDGKALVEELNKREGVKVIAACRLKSGDIKLTTESANYSKAMLNQQEWLASFGEGAKVKRTEYTVLAHGIRVAQVDTSKGKEAIQQIYQQNKGLQEKVEILRVYWTRKTARKGKVTGSLHIATAEPEQADHLIDNGLLWNYQLHDCEPFSGECSATQCLRCQGYGHIARFCGNPRKCGFCASGAHDTQECQWKNNREKYSCTICKKPEAKHTAWARECPERINQVNRARNAYIHRPTRFRPRTLSSQGLSIASSLFSFTAASSNSSRQGSQTPSIATEETRSKRPRIATQEGLSDTVMQDLTWKTVPAKRTGRPTALAVAARSSQNIQDLLSSQTSSLNE